MGQGVSGQRVSFSARGGWPLSCVGCVLGVSGFSLGDLSVLQIRTGTVGRWPWACVLGGFNAEGADFPMPSARTFNIRLG